MSVQSRMVLALAPAAAVLAFGCQRYTAKPVDLAAHHAEWLARTPGDDRVSVYAERLRESDALPPDFDLADGLSLVEAEVVALVLNAELRMARAEAGVAAATAENAGLWDDPVLGVDVMHVLESVPHPWMTAASVGFTIPISGRLGKERALADAEHAAALIDVAEKEWRTIVALREAWVKWSAAEEQLALAREYAEEVAALVEIVDEMLEAGEFSRLEARLFQIERLTSAQEIAKLEGASAAAVIELRRLLGLAPEAPLQLERQMGFPVGTPESESTAAMVMSRNPSLMALLADYESREKALELEIRKQYPDITLGPAHEYEDDQHRLGFGVSMPLPIFNANRLGIARALAERERARAELESELESLLSELAAAEARLGAATAQRTLVEEQVVPLVDAQFADAREVARLGEVDTWLLLETLRKRYETKRELIGLVREESVAVIVREMVIGPAIVPAADAEVAP